VEKLQRANALAPVPLARVASGPPVHAAPAAPATPAAAAPATPAAVVLASPSTTTPAVVTVKAERLKYGSKKDQRPVLRNTQRVRLEALEKWFKDTPASRPFLSKSFYVYNSVVAKFDLISQSYSEADASAAGTAAMTDISSVDVNQRYRDARKKDNDLLQPMLLRHRGQDLPPTGPVGSFSFAALESSPLFRDIRDTFLDAPDSRAVE
jgi:hypothetical protein